MRKCAVAILVAYGAISALNAEEPCSAYSLGIGVGWVPLFDVQATTFLRDDLAEVSANFAIIGEGRIAFEADFELGYGFALPSYEIHALYRYRGSLGARLRISPSGWIAFGFGAQLGAERLRYDTLDILGWYSRIEAFLESPISRNVAFGVSGGGTFSNDEFSLAGALVSMPILGYLRYRF